jgi:hypothetical protein
MFCPRCQTEYRAGFTRCSDCDADLVADPPQFALAGETPSEPGDPDQDPFCSFWKGEDARLHAEMCEVLEEAGVPHKTVFRSDHLFHFSNFPAYEIGVPFSRYQHAEAAIERAFGGEEPEDAARAELRQLQERIPARLVQASQVRDEAEQPEAEARDIPGPPSAGVEGHWYPEDATENIWSGEAGDQNDFFIAALHENGINCRLDEQGTQASLYVLPQSSERARRIIREIVENQPTEE